MTVATVEDLDRELVAQAAVSQRVVADVQRQHAVLEAEVDALNAEIEATRLALQDRTAELASVRAELARARAELQWLRRAGIDLQAIMDSLPLRVLRAGARRTRALARRLPSA